MAVDSSDDETPTIDVALANAARLLRNAELESDLMRMERVERLADSWVSIAGVLVAHTRS